MKFKSGKETNDIEMLLSIFNQSSDIEIYVLFINTLNNKIEQLSHNS